MKKILFFLVLLVFGLSFKICAVEIEDFELQNFDFYKSAVLNREMALADSIQYRFLYYPKINLQMDSAGSGNVTDGFGKTLFSPSVSFVQTLPGMVSMSIFCGSDFSKNDWNSEFQQAYNTGISFSVPLWNKKSLFSAYNQFASEYYSIYKRQINAVYDASVKSGYRDFIDCAGNILYYSRLCELYEVKAELLFKYCQDLEKLFALGKITSLELNDGNAKYSQQIAENLKCRKELLRFQTEYISMGGKNLPDLSFEDFTDVWKNYYSGQNETFLSDEIDFSNIELSRLMNAADSRNAVPFLSSDFEINSECFWNFSLSCKIPCFPDFIGHSKIERYKLADELYRNEKNRKARVISRSREERKASVKIYESYVQIMSRNLETENQRLDSYVKLNEIGRISDYEVSYQRNEVELCQLNKVYSDFQLVLVKAGFF